MGLQLKRQSAASTDPRRKATSTNAKFSRTGTALVCSLSLAAGLFIWFKLRVVTGMPRSAYADPDQQMVDVPPQRATEPTDAAARVEPRWAPDMVIPDPIQAESGFSPASRQTSDK